MATVQELMKLGEQMNLTGAGLKEFVREQQTLARDEREKERAEKEREREREERGKEKEREEREKERVEREKDRQFEMERLKLMEVGKRLELQAKLENPRDRPHVLRKTWTSQRSSHTGDCFVLGLCPLGWSHSVTSCESC